MERDMDSELHFMSTRGPIISSPPVSNRAAATRQARLELGDPLRLERTGSEARGLRLVDECAPTLRYGARWLRRSPAFAAAAVPLDCAWDRHEHGELQPGHAVLLTLMPVDHPGIALAPFSI